MIQWFSDLMILFNTDKVISSLCPVVNVQGQKYLTKQGMRQTRAQPEPATAQINGHLHGDGVWLRLALHPKETEW